MQLPRVLSTCLQLPQVLSGCRHCLLCHQLPPSTVDLIICEALAGATIFLANDSWNRARSCSFLALVHALALVLVLALFKLTWFHGISRLSVRDTTTGVPVWNQATGPWGFYSSTESSTSSPAQQGQGRRHDDIKSSWQTPSEATAGFGLDYWLWEPGIIRFFHCHDCVNKLRQTSLVAEPLQFLIWECSLLR